MNHTLPTFKKFAKEANAVGLEARDCGNGHWQVRGKGLIVNYWPFSRRKAIYVCGTTTKSGTYATIQDVFQAATEIPDINKKEKRHGTYKRQKLRMLKFMKECRWCKAPLDEKTATVDHVIPLSRGGLNNSNNLVLACEPCNRRRGNTMPELRLVGNA